MSSHNESFIAQPCFPDFGCFTLQIAETHPANIHLKHPHLQRLISRLAASLKLLYAYFFSFLGFGALAKPHLRPHL
jgi:hypothetical protein